MLDQYNIQMLPYLVLAGLLGGLVYELNKHLRRAQQIIEEERRQIPSHFQPILDEEPCQLSLVMVTQAHYPRAKTVRLDDHTIGQAAFQRFLKKQKLNDGSQKRLLEPDQEDLLKELCREKKFLPEKDAKKTVKFENNFDKTSKEKPAFSEKGSSSAGSASKGSPSGGKSELLKPSLKLGSDLGNSQINVGGMATDKKGTENKAESLFQSNSEVLKIGTPATATDTKPDAPKPSTTETTKLTSLFPKSTTGLGTTAFDQPNSNVKISNDSSKEAGSLFRNIAQGDKKEGLFSNFSKEEKKQGQKTQKQAQKTSLLGKVDNTSMFYPKQDLNKPEKYLKLIKQLPPSLVPGSLFGNTASASSDPSSTSSLFGKQKPQEHKTTKPAEGPVGSLFSKPTESKPSENKSNPLIPAKANPLILPEKATQTQRSKETIKPPNPFQKKAGPLMATTTAEKPPGPSGGLFDPSVKSVPIGPSPSANLNLKTAGESAGGLFPSLGKTTTTNTNPLATNPLQTAKPGTGGLLQSQTTNTRSLFSQNAIAPQIFTGLTGGSGSSPMFGGSGGLGGNTGNFGKAGDNQSATPSGSLFGNLLPKPAADKKSALPAGSLFGNSNPTPPSFLKQATNAPAIQIPNLSMFGAPAASPFGGSASLFTSSSTFLAKK